MVNEKLFTLRQISQELNLPESTVRYYRDLFSHYLPTVGKGRRRRYPEKAVSLLRQVADGYSENRSKEEIETHLNSMQEESVETEPLVGFGSGGSSTDSSDESVARYLEGERDRRDAMWHMAREIVRLGETIDRQGAMLGELAKQLAERSSRTLSTQATPAPSDPAPPKVPEYSAPAPVAETPPATDQPATWSMPAPDLPAAQQPASSEEGEAGPRETSRMAGPMATQRPVPVARPAAPPELTEVDAPVDEMDTLREQLASERDLVERLRKSKMDIERRAAAAESRLGYGSESPTPRSSRKSMFTRFFNR